MHTPDPIAAIVRNSGAFTKGAPVTPARMRQAIEDHLLAEAGEDLIDRTMEGEAVEWLDEAGTPIDLTVKPRAVTDLAVTVPLYYDWDVLRVRGTMLLAAASGDTLAMLDLPSLIRLEVFNCRKPAE